MSECQSLQPQPKSIQNVNNDLGLMDVLIILAKRKKWFFILPVLFAFIGVVISFSMTSFYKANTKILPPQQSQSSAAAMLNQLGGFSGMAGSALGVKNANDIYVGMLTSHAITDKLIQRFDLKKVYGAKYLSQVRDTLEANTTVTVGKKDGGMIFIEVIDTHPERAAQIANAYVEELAKLTSTLAVTDASRRRLFFEQQLESTKNKLVKAESMLKGALDTRGVISVDGQSRAMVGNVATLRAQISAKEIELGAMQAFVTANNQEHKRIQYELNSMRAELTKLENGSLIGGRRIESAGQVLKQAGLGNIQFLRDVKYYEMLYELLAKQYEVARLDESKDASIIQVLDKAIVPEDRFKPKRTMIVLTAGMIGLALAVLWAVIAEIMERAKKNPNHELQLTLFKSYLKFK